MSTSPRRWLPALVVLNSLVIVAVAWQAYQLSARHEAAVGRALEIARNAEASLDALRFQEAAALHRQAAGLAWAAGASDVAAEQDAQADAARALHHVAAGTTPAPDSRALRGLVTSLRASAPDHDAREPVVAAAALEVALLRAEGRAEDSVIRGRELARDPAAQGPWLRWQIGLALAGLGRTAEAVEELKVVVEALPRFGPAFHRLGALQAVLGDAAAATTLTRAVELGAGPTAGLDLARVLIGSGDFPRAAQHLERVLAARPDHAEAMRQLALARFQTGQPAEAGQLYERSFQAEPDPRTLVSAAMAWRKAGDGARALALLNQAVPAADRAPAARFERGMLLLENKRTHEGLADLAAYLSLAAGRPEEAKRLAAARDLLSRHR